MSVAISSQLLAFVARDQAGNGKRIDVFQAIIIAYDDGRMNMWYLGYDERGKINKYKREELVIL